MEETVICELKEEAIHYEILLGLYLDAQRMKEENAKIGAFTIDNIPNTMFCYGCTKPIKKGEKFIVFHNPHECIRYAQILLWKEAKSSCIGKKG